MNLRITTYAPTPTTFDILKAGVITGYTVTSVDWGDAAWEIAYSARRGTQGSRAVGGAVDNRAVSIAIRILSSGADNMAALLNALEDVADELRRFGGRISRKHVGGSYWQHFEVQAGTCASGTWDNAANRGVRMSPLITAVCQPYAHGDSTGFSDDLTTDIVTAGDWSLAIAGSDPPTFAANGMGAGSATGTTQSVILRESGNTYAWPSIVFSLKTPSSLPAGGFRAAAVVTWIDASNYAWVGVEDTGAASRLVAGVVVAGAETTTTVALTRLSVSSTYWVRAIRESAISAGTESIRAWIHTIEPDPLNTGTTGSITRNLTAPQITAIPASGKIGLLRKAAATNLLMGPVRGRWFYMNPPADGYPAIRDLSPTIPGTAPALADISFTASSTDPPPAWALIAAYPKPATTGTITSVTPAGVIENKTASGVGDVGFSINAVDAGARGGRASAENTAVAATSLQWTIAPWQLTPDDYTDDECEVEFWARMKITSTAGVTHANLFACPTNSSGDVLGTPRYTEWGPTGKSVTLPASGSQWRLVRLGSLNLHADSANIDFVWSLNLSLTHAAANVISVDYLIAVPIRSRIAGPTSRPLDANYPRFLVNVATFGTLTKTINKDGSGSIRTYVHTGYYPDHALGGALEIPPGNATLLVKLSDLVPDDPTVDATTERLAYTGVVEVDVTPRWGLVRS